MFTETVLGVKAAVELAASADEVVVVIVASVVVGTSTLAVITVAPVNKSASVGRQIPRSAPSPIIPTPAQTPV